MFESFGQYVDSAVSYEECVLELSRQLSILGNCRPVIQPLLISPCPWKMIWFHQDSFHFYITFSDRELVNMM